MSDNSVLLLTFSRTTSITEPNALQRTTSTTPLIEFDEECVALFAFPRLESGSPSAASDIKESRIRPIRIDLLSLRTFLMEMN